MLMLLSLDVQHSLGLTSRTNPLPNLSISEGRHSAGAIVKKSGNKC